MKYFIKTPWWLKKLYPKRLWSVDTKDKIIHLTFDDGPHPVATPFVLDQLAQHNAKATFFCIGNNVVTHPLLYDRILKEGHRVGNHTHHHYNGWKTTDATYLSDIAEAAKHINTDLFRPPYGRLRSSQAKHLNKAMDNRSVKIIMWDVLSGDFDVSLDKEKCLKQVTGAVTPGSIIVFHDSEKALPTLEYVLPGFLAWASQQGYRFQQL